MTKPEKIRVSTVRISISCTGAVKYTHTKPPASTTLSFRVEIRKERRYARKLSINLTLPNPVYDINVFVKTLSREE
jgi:hypothetical protein